MLDMYEEFLMNSLVIEIRWMGDLPILCDIFKKMGLKKIGWFYKTYNGDFNSLLSNYPLGELCLEYQLGKGFTISGKTDNLNYGNKVVLSTDFIKEMNQAILSQFIEKRFLKIFDEAEKLEDKINVSLKIKNRTGNNKNIYYVGHCGYFPTEINPRIFKSKKALLNALNQFYDLGAFDEFEYEIEYR